MKKQIGYANAMGVAYFAIIGESELAEGTCDAEEYAYREQADHSTADGNL